MYLQQSECFTEMFDRHSFVCVSVTLCGSFNVETNIYSLYS